MPLLWTVGSGSARGHGGIWEDRAAGLLPEGAVLGGDTPSKDGDTPSEDGDVPVEDSDVPKKDFDVPVVCLCCAE